MLFLYDAESSLLWSELIGARERFIFLVCALLSFGPAFREIEFSRPGLPRAYATLALFMLATVSLTNSSFNPFIYFRF